MSKDRLLKGRAPIVSHQTILKETVPMPKWAELPEPIAPDDYPNFMFLYGELEQKTPDWVMQMLPVGVGFLIGVLVTLLLVTLGL